MEHCKCVPNKFSCFESRKQIQTDHYNTAGEALGPASSWPGAQPGRAFPRPGPARTGTVGTVSLWQNLGS